MLPDFGQADPLQGVTSHLEGVLALLLFSLQALLVPGVKFVESVLALAFGFGPQTTEDRFDFSSRLGAHLFDFGSVFQQASQMCRAVGTGCVRRRGGRSGMIFTSRSD